MASKYFKLNLNIPNVPTDDSDSMETDDEYGEYFNINAYQPPQMDTEYYRKLLRDVAEDRIKRRRAEEEEQTKGQRIEMLQKIYGSKLDAEYPEEHAQAGTLKEIVELFKSVNRV